MENRLVIAAIRLQQKIHRLDQSILFIESCMETGKIPRFEKMGLSVRKKLSKSNLKSGEIKKLEMKSLVEEVKSHRGKIFNLQSEVNTIFEKIKKQSETLSKFETLKIGIKNRVASLEANRDKNRDRKLDILLKTHKNDNTVNTVDVLNLTEFEIPSEVKELLRFGRNYGIGGSQKEDEIFLELNRLYDNFQINCADKEISDTIKHTIKAHSFITVQSLKNCYTSNNLTKKFFEFKKENDAIFVFCDKSSQVAYINQKDYDSKVSDLFDNSRFEKFIDFKIEPHLIEYRKLLRETIGPCVNNIKMLNLHPTYTIADFYGTLKLHREGTPLRPICTGYLSFTNNVEEYIKEIISPLISECKYLVSSTKEFKERFMIHKQKFDITKHEILCLDIT